jgi:hypothetical protein
MVEAKALEILLKTLKEVIPQVGDEALRKELMDDEKKYKRWHARASKGWEKRPLTRKIRRSKVYEVGLKAVAKWPPGTVFSSSEARNLGGDMCDVWYQQLCEDGFLQRRPKIIGKGCEYEFIEDAPRILNKFRKLRDRGRSYAT